MGKYSLQTLTAKDNVWFYEKGFANIIANNVLFLEDSRGYISLRSIKVYRTINMKSNFYENLMILIFIKNILL